MDNLLSTRLANWTWLASPLNKRWPLTLLNGSSMKHFTDSDSIISNKPNDIWDSRSLHTFTRWSMFGRMKGFHCLPFIVHIHGKIQRNCIDIILIEKLTHETIANFRYCKIVRNTWQLNHLWMVWKSFEYSQTPGKFLLSFCTGFTHFQLNPSMTRNHRETFNVLVWSF